MNTAFKSIEHREARSAPQSQSICQQILADLREAEPMQLPLDAAQFNDDDLYVYDAKTKQLINQHSCTEQQVKDARYIGFRVAAGQTWAKGMAAKHLGLWRAA